MRYSKYPVFRVNLFPIPFLLGAALPETEVFVQAVKKY